MKVTLKRAKTSLISLGMIVTIAFPLTLGSSTVAGANSSPRTLTWSQWKKEMIPLATRYTPVINEVKDYYNKFNQNLWGADLTLFKIVAEMDSLKSPDPKLNRLIYNWMYASKKFGTDVAVSYVRKIPFATVDYYWKLLIRDSGLVDKRLSYDVSH